MPTPSALRSYVPAYLRTTGGPQRVPFPGQSVTFATIAAAMASPSGDNGLFLAFTLMLRQLVFEFGLFDAAPSQAAQRILAALDKVSLRFKTGGGETRQSAAAFLRTAASGLVLRTSGTPVLMPLEWPALDAGAGSAIQNAVAEIVNARLQAIRPQEGRFDNPRNRYVLKGYARIKRGPECPPATVSSANSQVFSIAPWYEGKGPPVPIVLPEMNMDALKQLKPNVAFAVPNQLQSLLDLNDAKDLADGKGKNSSVQMTVDWLCSFSLPVITLCAFIVLNIFLQLLNIIFQWLLWFKICIPVPRPAVSDE